MLDWQAPGEPIQCDDTGTCRRWNWRQGPRTALNDESALLDTLELLSPDAPIS